MKTRIYLKEVIKNNYAIILGMSCLFFVDFFIILHTKGMTTPVDEIGMFAVAAKLAGYDWSGVISESGYYGFGYFGLFAPLFKYVENPETIHKIILVSDSILKIAVIPIIYNIELRFLNIQSKTYAGLVAVMLSVINVSLRTRPYNEFPLHLLLWFDMWLLCKLIQVYDDKKKRIKYTTFLMITLVYGILLHARAVTLIYAFAVTFIVLFLIQKKGFISIKPVVMGLALWHVAAQLVCQVQEFVWGASGSQLGNTTVTITSQIDILNSKMYLLWFDMIIGNIGMMLLQTGGIFSIAIIALILGGINWIREKKIEKEELYIFSMSFCTILCMGATILALMVSGWYGGMAPTFFEEQYGNKVYAYKGMVYLRYWGLYITPFILSGLAILYKNNWWKKVTSKVVFFSAMLIIIFLQMVLPWIENNSSCLTFTQALAAWKQGDVCNRESYLHICIVFGVFFSILIWGINTNKKNLVLCIFIFFFVYQQVWSAVYFDIPITQEIYELVDASVEKLNSLDEKDFPKRIYSLEFDEKRSASYKQSLSLQYYFMEQTIYTNISDGVTKGDLIITREEIPMEVFLDYLPDVTYQFEQIDADEFWYTILDS